MKGAEVNTAGWGKAYAGQDVQVYFNSARCIHYAACVRGLPQVFRPKERPWVLLGDTPAEAVAEVVRRCPTGALHYTLEGGPDEQPTPGGTVIEPRPDGPLFIEGDVVVRTPDGDLRDTRVALCRCGQSANQPFCDGTHTRVGWKSQP